MAGWYAARGKYVPEELGGLSVTRFCEAVRAEGTTAAPGLNMPLHLHPLFQDVDVYGHGKPTINANSSRDVRTQIGSLPVAENVAKQLYSIPWFKHYEPELIDQHAAAFKKVALQYEQLLEGDQGNPERLGAWNSTRISR